MAKKQYTPEEYKAKLEKKAEKNKKFATTFLKVLAFSLAIAMVFCASTIAHTRTGMLAVSGSNSVNAGNQNSTGDNSTDGGNDSTDWGDSNDTQAPSTDNLSDSSDNSSNSNSDNTANNNNNSNNSNNNSNNSNNNANTDKPSTDSSKSDQEILDMYKTGIANARTKSSKVIRVKDGAINYKGVAEAGKLSSVLTTLMDMFMVKDEASIEVKNEEWEKEKLPDASALTLNGIKEIKRADKGDTYVIRVVAKDAKNPKANGDGVGSVAGVIEESQITGAIGSVPGLTLEGISIDYENVTAIATIDKATGNCIALDINAPCFLNVGHAKVPLLGEIDNARVGIQVITEYKIEY